MNGVILYQSKYGATKRYAEWLSEEIGFQCIETKKADINEIITYDPIILGGGIYASGIAGLSFLKKNINKLLYFVAVHLHMKKIHFSKSKRIT